MNPVIKIGNKRTLTEADMPSLAKRDQAVHVQDLVEVRRRRRKREGGREEGDCKGSTRKSDE